MSTPNIPDAWTSLRRWSKEGDARDIPDAANHWADDEGDAEPMPMAIGEWKASLAVAFAAGMRWRSSPSVSTSDQKNDRCEFGDDCAYPGLADCSVRGHRKVSAQRRPQPDGTSLRDFAPVVVGDQVHEDVDRVLCVRARLDPDGTARPRTEIVAVMPGDGTGAVGQTIHVGQATHYVARPTTRPSEVICGERTTDLRFGDAHHCYLPAGHDYEHESLSPDGTVYMWRVFRDPPQQRSNDAPAEPAPESTQMLLAPTFTSVDHLGALNLEWCLGGPQGSLESWRVAFVWDPVEGAMSCKTVHDGQHTISSPGAACHLAAWLKDEHHPRPKEATPGSPGKPAPDAPPCWDCGKPSDMQPYCWTCYREESEAMQQVGAEEARLKTRPFDGAKAIGLARTIVVLTNNQSDVHKHAIELRDLISDAPCSDKATPQCQICECRDATVCTQCHDDDEEAAAVAARLAPDKATTISDYDAGFREAIGQCAEYVGSAELAAAFLSFAPAHRSHSPPWPRAADINEPCRQCPGCGECCGCAAT